MTNFEVFGMEFFIRMYAEKRVGKGTRGWVGDFEQEYNQYLQKDEAIDKEIEWLKQEYGGDNILEQRMVDEFNNMRDF